jgi:hypothetical protein
VKSSYRMLDPCKIPSIGISRNIVPCPTSLLMHNVSTGISVLESPLTFCVSPNSLIRGCSIPLSGIPAPAGSKQWAEGKVVEGHA